MGCVRTKRTGRSPASRTTTLVFTLDLIREAQHRLARCVPRQLVDQTRQVLASCQPLKEAPARRRRVRDPVDTRGQVVIRLSLRNLDLSHRNGARGRGAPLFVRRPPTSLRAPLARPPDRTRLPRRTAAQTRPTDKGIRTSPRSHVIQRQRCVPTKGRAHRLEISGTHATELGGWPVRVLQCGERH